MVTRDRWAHIRRPAKPRREQFNKAIGRSVARATERDGHDHGFEQARAAYFEGEGLGRADVSAAVLARALLMPPPVFGALGDHLLSPPLPPAGRRPCIAELESMLTLALWPAASNARN